MKKIILTFDGEYKEEEIEIFSKWKNGEKIGIDPDTNMPIYSQVEAKVWKTSIGNFHSDIYLDRFRFDDNQFFIYTETNENYKEDLIQFAIDCLKTKVLDWQKKVEKFQNELDNAKVNVGNMNIKLLKMESLKYDL